MIVIARTATLRADNSTVHDTFLAMLPQIKQQAHCAYRGRDPEAREELVQEVIANAYVAFAELVRRGKQHVAFASPLARYAVRQVHSGRRVGSRLNIRDAMSPYAGRARGITVERLDSYDDGDCEWKDVVVEDRHASPADIAASRLDLGMWFRSLPGRSRRIAQTLASGETTMLTAKKFRLSAARVSQLRRELEASWRELQGESANA